VTKARKVSTFRRAGKLFSTISGRRNYTDAGEKFEKVTMMLFHPITLDASDPKFQLIDPESFEEICESDYFLMLRGIYNDRNPHSLIDDDEPSDGEGNAPSQTIV
jgi:hypothetical protein